MDDLISRQSAIEACEHAFVNKVFVADAIYNQGVENCLKRIKELPSVQPTIEERKKGHVITRLDMREYGKAINVYFCSVCGKQMFLPQNYCPNCGAKMEE